MFEKNNIHFDEHYNSNNTPTTHVIYTDINDILNNNKNNTNKMLAICDKDVICIG